jgi:hypothetical protein
MTLHMYKCFEEAPAIVAAWRRLIALLAFFPQCGTPWRAPSRLNNLQGLGRVPAALGAL